MNVRIGVLHTSKELEIEMDPDTDFDDLRNDIDAVLAAGQGVLWLTDKRDRQIAVPVERIGWVDLAPRSTTGRIGFGA